MAVRVFPRFWNGACEFMSRRSRAQTGTSEEVFLVKKKMAHNLLQGAEGCKKTDYFIFGHRHLAIDYRLSPGSRYINLGDWIRYYTYAVFDGNELHLKSYQGAEEKIIRKS